MKNKSSRLLLFAAICLAGFHGGVTAKEAAANLDLVRQLNQAFIDVADRVSPSVVVITVTQKPITLKPDAGGDSPLDQLPPEFWKYFHRRFQEAPPEKSQGQGSGIIIREDGYILTNGHVVEDAEKIEVHLKDGRRFKAEVRGTDPQSDIAVIKIEAKGLPVATFADSSQTRVGEFAIAIGAPFQLDYSVTFGHVSAKGRGNVVPSYAGGAMMDQDFIQTDANINPGNSGGPLVNINGEVIGMNTLIRGLQTGIGFAIPSNLAKEVSAQLIAEGKFTRAWLGIGIRALKEDQAFRELVTSVSEGVVVASILPEGPAYKSDLKPADVITAVDGKAVATVQALKDEIRGKKIGAPVTLDVVRNDKNIKVKVSPGEWIDKAVAAKTASEEAGKDNVSALGLTVQAFTRELAEQFSVELTEGVIVTAVEKNSAAARSLIKPGDVVTDVNQRKVTGPRAFRELLKGADLKKGVLLNLISGNTSRFEILKEADE